MTHSKTTTEYFLRLANTSEWPLSLERFNTIIIALHAAAEQAAELEKLQASETES